MPRPSQPHAFVSVNSGLKAPFVRLSVEQLESRDVPSAFYDLSTIAKTGGPEQFVRFGDQVSINDQGDVAFVGFTNKQGTVEDGLASGLWVSKLQQDGLLPGSTATESLKNINREYSINEARDFGRVATITDAMEENGTSHPVQVIARDRETPSYFLRKWDTTSTQEQHSNVAAAIGSGPTVVNSFWQNLYLWIGSGFSNVYQEAQQTSFGKYSAFSTFAAANARGDVAFLALSSGASDPSNHAPATWDLYVVRAGQTNPVLYDSFAGNAVPPRPQLTDDGKLLYLKDAKTLVLASSPSDSDKKVVASAANGFEKLGNSPSISDDGRIVVFAGKKGNKGEGVYVSYPTASGRAILRIVGENIDGFTLPDLNDAVAVNSTLKTERGVTVAFEAKHANLGTGIYSSRVSFFGTTMTDFQPNSIVTARANGVTPVARIGKETVGVLGAITDVELWQGVSDRNRGEIAFWAATDKGQAIVRAEPTPVVYLEFAPKARYNLDARDSGVFPRATIDLLREAGLDTFGWDGDVADALAAGGLVGPAAVGSIDAFQAAVIQQVQSYFKNAGTPVRVLGGSNGQGEPESVPWDGPDGQGYPVKYGAFQRVLIGESPNTILPTYGFSSGVFGVGPGPEGTLDFFNQVPGDVAVVFPDRIFFAGISSAGYTPGVPGVSLSSLDSAQKVAAVASVVAHEAGHNFGLAHLLPDPTNGSIMREEPTAPIDFYRDDLGFLSGAFPLAEVPGSEEDSRRRLRFAVGGEDGDGPNVKIIDAGLSLKFTSTLTGATFAVSRLVLGVAAADHLLPTFYDLGGGSLGDVLARAKVAIPTGGTWFLFGTTDGQAADIIAVQPGHEQILSTLPLTQLGVALEERLRFDPGTGTSLNLFRLTGGTAVLLGSVGPVTAPAIDVSAVGLSVATGGTLGLGTTRRGGDALVKTVTVRNSGTDTLTVGTVAVTGAGYSVTQPAVTTLAPGASTTFTVTLSSATPGLNIAGTLTIPTNDPSGPFVLNLRGDVTAKPDVLAVTRLADAGGQLVIAIDFSERLQTGPATDAKNFALVSPSGTGLALASAAYSEVGGVYRVTLTSTASGPFPYGQYGVRFNGAAIRSLSGTPAVEPIDRLLIEVGERNEYVTVGLGANGQLGVDGGPTSFGAGPPKWIDGADFNGDGFYDLVTTSAQTSEVILFYGQPEGGFAAPVRFVVEAPADRESRPGRAVAYDWDRNGTTDLVVWDNATGLTGQYWGGRYPRIVIYLNDGHGNFAVAPDMPIPLGEGYMWQEGTMAVGAFGPGGSSGIALNGPSTPGDGTPYGTNASVQIVAKDPFVGYTPQITLPTGKTGWTPSEIFSADFNGDGRPDLVTNTGGYYVYEQGPVLNLSTPTGYATAVHPGLVAIVNGVEQDAVVGVAVAGDFNGDGRPDLVVLHHLDDEPRPADRTRILTLLTWDATLGRMVPHEAQVVAEQSPGSPVGAADLDRDGKADLLLWTGVGLVPWYSRGDGSFRKGDPVSLAASGSTSPVNFLFRDVTGDGFVDALFGNTAGGRIGLLTNNGIGVLQANAPSGPTVGGYPLAASSTVYDQRLVTGDFNRDGRIDFVRAGTELMVFLAGAASGYTTSTIPANLTGSNAAALHWLQVGDLNRDGNLDLLVGTAGERLVGRVWLGNGDGTFRAGAEVGIATGTVGNVFRGALADVNLDGNLDLVGQLQTTGSGEQFTGFAVWFGNGTGSLTYNPNTRVDVTGVGETYAALTPNVADVTGDGIPDVVVRGYGAGLQVVTYPGRGNGTFANGVITAVGVDPGVNFVPLDYDGDGKTDLAGYAYRTGGGAEGTVYVLRGNGNGTFGQPVALPGAWSQRGVTRVQSGDFDGDGKADVAVLILLPYPALPQTLLRVYRGDGAGGFAMQEFALGGQTVPRLVGVSIADDGPWSLSTNAIAFLPGDTWVDAGTVTPPLPPPPPAPAGGQPLAVTTVQGTPVLVIPPSVPGIPQLIAVGTPPAHGTVRIDDNGTPNNPGDDRFLYVPAPGYSGPDTWEYVAGNAGGATVGTVAVTVTPDPSHPTLPFADPFAQGVAFGLAWNTVAGAIFTGYGNALATAAGENVAVVKDISAADVAVSAVVRPQVGGGLSATGLVARRTTNGDLYWGALNTFDQTFRYSAQIWKRANGIWSVLNFNAVPIDAAFAEGKTLRFEVLGSSLKLYLNDVLVSYAFDDALPAAGGVGLRTGFGAVLDDFAAVARPAVASALPFADAFAADPPRQALPTTWQDRAGYVTVTGGRATGRAARANTATPNGVSAADVAVSAVVQPRDGGLLATGLVARYTGAGDVGSPMANLYWGALNVFGDQPYTQYSAQIWKIVAGVPVNLTFNAIPIDPADAVGKVLRFEVVGSSLKLYLGDVLVCFCTDTSLAGPGRVGLRVGQGAALDDFAAAVLAPITPALPFTDGFPANPPRQALSAAWQERSGFFSVATGRAVGGSVGQVNVATVNGVSVADVTVAADFFLTGAGPEGGVVARYQGGAGGTGASNFYAATVAAEEDGDAVVRIIRNANGQEVELGRQTLAGFFAGGFGTPVTGFRFKLLGDQLSIILGSTTLLTVSDAAFAAGSVGIRAGRDVGVDDFAAATN